ncbi:MAG: DUF445 domain-containing protein [Kineosporiaceae bacterium]|nr:DUF445 domain-containing protein [Kineosporiaceae bacterium]
MKLVATGLLALAALIYVATLPGRHSGWLGFVNTAAEAAMVGAVADWFAVTALFRHPLGLRIPHTAIIPTRKDALGHNLEDFVGTHFLAEDVVRERVARAGISRRVGIWLSRRAGAERATAELASLARGALTVMKDETVLTVLDEVFVRKVLNRPWGPPSGRLLARIVADGAHHRLVDVGADHLHEWLSDHEDVIIRLVLERAPTWTPNWLDHRVAQRAYVEALTFAADVRADPHHRARKALDSLLTEFAHDLQNDPEAQAKADAFRDRLLSHPDVRGAVEQLWTTVRRSLEEAVDDPGSDLRVRTTDAVQSFGERLVADQALQRRLDGYAEDAAAHLVTSYRDEVVTVISETVQRWDGEGASRRIELHVGRDLQFIRINGTVVGGLVGLVIHTITVLIG